MRSIDPPQGLGCLDNGDCLDRDVVSKSFSFAVDDAWSEHIALGTVPFGGVDDSRVCSDALQKNEY